MLNEFILAAALICPTANQVTVQEVITTKPIPFMQCDKMSQDKEIREKHLKMTTNKKDCEIDLICVRVHWAE